MKNIHSTTQIEDCPAITAFSVPATGSTNVTSGSATDLNTVAQGLHTTASELSTLATKVNALLAELRNFDIIQS